MGKQRLLLITTTPSNLAHTSNQLSAPPTPVSFFFSLTNPRPPARWEIPYFACVEGPGCAISQRGCIEWATRCGEMRRYATGCLGRGLLRRSLVGHLGFVRSLSEDGKTRLMRALLSNCGSVPTCWFQEGEIGKQDARYIEGGLSA
jgi:hypothetical protein